MSNIPNLIRLSIAAITFSPSPNVKLALFEQSPFLSSQTNPLASIHSSTQLQGINTYTLPRNSRVNSYPVVTDGMKTEQEKDRLWETIKPLSWPSGHASPCVFPFPQGDEKGTDEAVLTVSIGIPALFDDDPDSPKIEKGSYILVGQPEAYAYQFVSDPIEIEQKEGEIQELDIKTRLETKSSKPSISAFRGKVSWTLQPGPEKATNNEIPCLVNAKASHFMEFYVVGNNIPQLYSDRKNTFGIPIYLLRMLIPKNIHMPVAEYRSRVVQWAFSESKKVYNRFTGDGHGARYVSQVDFSRSYGLFQSNGQMTPEAAEFESDESQRFFIDWYLLESIAAHEGNVVNVEKLPRVNCPDQANIVRVGLDISCMKGEEGAKILGLKGNKGNILIDGMLVGFEGRTNNAFINLPKKGEEVPIDRDLNVPMGSNVKRQGFRQHFCVSMGKGNDEKIYDATIARITANSQPAYIDGILRPDYMGDIIQTAGAELSKAESELFFAAPRYSSPFLDLM